VHPSSEPTVLDGDLVLRRARPDDFEQILSLSLEAHGPQERFGVGYVTDRYGIDAWTVVTDADRVVSTCMLMAHRLEIGPTDGVSVTVPAGQVEYVATDPAYQRRGLVRAQFDAHHQVADARGDQVVFVAGIPYFYRHLGYSYGVSYPTVYRLAPDALVAHDGWQVRPATADDLTAIQELHDRALATSDVRIGRSTSDWHALLDDPATNGEIIHVAVLDGVVRGWMRFDHYERDNLSMLIQGASADLTAAEVLVRHSLELSGGAPLYVLERTGDPLGALLASVAHASDDFNAIYTRIADPLAFLEAIRPLLDDRLTRSVLAAETGELVLSLYGRSLRVAYERGAIVDLAWAPGIEEPDGVTAIGVPPDAFAPLVLGRFGASGLAARIDDLTLGRQRALADVLFPPLVADIIGVL
jgi:predicted N-acetyltransferase YhbS